MNVKDFAEKFIKAEKEAWQNGNFDALEKLEDPNVKYHLMELGQNTEGWEAHKQFITTARQNLIEIKQEWKYLVGEGNLFALTYKSHAKMKGNLPGLPPLAGKETDAYTLFLFHLKNGKIIEAWENGTYTGLI